MTANDASLLERAIDDHQQGRLESAEELYLRILSTEPLNFSANRLLGLLRAKQGRYAEALELLDKAITADPNAAVAHLNYGNVLRFTGCNEESLSHYDRALALAPDFAEGWNNRGSVLCALGRFSDALSDFDRALAIQPGFPGALNNKALALRELGRLNNALASSSMVLTVSPNSVIGLNTHGLILYDLKRPTEALESFDRTLMLKPDYVEALNNRGMSLFALRRFEEALVSYDRTLAIAPGYWDCWSNRGLALRELARFDEALESLDHALTIKPDFAPALNARGNLRWIRKKEYKQALFDLQRALAINPTYAYAQGEILHLRMIAGDWEDYDLQVADIDAGVRSGKRVVQPFVYQAIAKSPADMQTCSVLYASHISPPAAPLCVSRTHAHKKIRLAYMSGEFRDHANGFNTVGLFEYHDRNRFEVIALDNGHGGNGPIRKRMEAAFDKFIPIADLSDHAAAARILSEEIDVLVNLNGYFGSVRMEIFAQKPAPIQVNYLGTPGTLGASFIDYIIADSTVIPDDEFQFYTEAVVHLPDTYWVTDSKRPIAPVIPSRLECGLPEHGFVFCNFNQSYKLTPETFAVWMRILAKVDGSVLWLLESNPEFAKNLSREALRHGLAPERLIFARPLAPEAHLARLKQADLSLDSLPYNAHTTAIDVLWAGVPLITCAGSTFPGRVAASQLRALGLDDLVTQNWQEYEALAVKLSREPSLLNSFRERLEENKKTLPLFDTDRFRRNMETAYEKMSEIWQRGENPRHFRV